MKQSLFLATFSMLSGSVNVWVDLTFTKISGCCSRKVRAIRRMSAGLLPFTSNVIVWAPAGASCGSGVATNTGLVSGFGVGVSCVSAICFSSVFCASASALAGSTLSSEMIW